MDYSLPGSFVHGILQARILEWKKIIIILEWLALSFSNSYVTTKKTIALTIWTFVGKVMSLLFKMLSRFVIAFLPRIKHLLISCL